MLLNMVLLCLVGVLSISLIIKSFYDYLAKQKLQGKIDQTSGEIENLRIVFDNVQNVTTIIQAKEIEILFKLNEQMAVINSAVTYLTLHISKYVASEGPKQISKDQIVSALNLFGDEVLKFQILKDKNSAFYQQEIKVDIDELFTKYLNLSNFALNVLIDEEPLESLYNQESIEIHDNEIYSAFGIVEKKIRKYLDTYSIRTPGYIYEN